MAQRTPAATQKEEGDPLEAFMVMYRILIKKKIRKDKLEKSLPFLCLKSVLKSHTKVGFYHVKVSVNRYYTVYPLKREDNL